MWLVVGGPLLVVVASIVTVVLAMKNPDTVLDKTDYERELANAKALTGQARTEAMARFLPATQARNHAASPLIPEDDEKP
jgi:hypothetical protein